MSTRSDGHLILGAGCAGLSLACALLDAGVDEPITLVDARTDFGRDRTWCLFDVRATPFADLATHRWTTWEIGGVACHDDRHPYVRLDSPDVYAVALRRLERAPNVELRLGEAVRSIGDGSVVTDRGVLRAARVYDALSLGSPGLRGLRPQAWQTFLGHEVTVAEPVFDPGVATLMDFDVPQPRGGVAFLYVLPFDERRALVEHTVIGTHAVPAAERRRVIEGFLERRGAGARTVTHRERGAIPMTTGPLARPGARHAIPIGTAGGAVRPSSGYAFGRIQAQVAGVVADVIAGRTPDARVGSPRTGAMDAIFLRVLAAEPERFPAHFRRLAERVPAAALARFLGDAGTVLDDARIVAALPKTPFAAAALRVPGPAPVGGRATVDPWSGDG